MKYIILSFLLLGLASCSVPNPLNDDSTKEVNIQDVDFKTLTESGIITGSGNENEENTGSISEESESGTLNESRETQHEEKEDDDVTKDPEIESIQKDIDKIFEDIGGEIK
ncbi:MAG: hypothetical protein PHQ95_03020 [Candidatus Gracilibacteria bacterium]|nr:hypothetical protein [Candidatus Gracilibacteria bacterium]